MYSICLLVCEDLKPNFNWIAADASRLEKENINADKGTHMGSWLSYVHLLLHLSLAYPNTQFNLDLHQIYYKNWCAAKQTSYSSWKEYVDAGRYFPRGSAGISRRKFRNLTGNFTQKSRTFVAFWVSWITNDRKKPWTFNLHWLDISLVHNFISKRKQWLMITVSAPSYRSYRKEDTCGCFNILRKGMSKLGSMEAFSQ